MVVIKSEDFNVEKMNQMFQYGHASGKEGEAGEGASDGAEMDPDIDYDALTQPPRGQTDTDSTASTCGSLRVIEIAIVFDSSFCNAFWGSSGATSRIQAIIGLVNQKYQQDGLCTAFEISDIEGYCSQSTDPLAEFVSDNDFLLDRFREWMNTNVRRREIIRDTAHLFTGTDFSSDLVIGRAYIKTVCNLEWAYGINWITFTYSLTAQSMLVAHELGHNLGADHFGESNSGHVMNPAINSAPNGFSSQSVSSMNSYLNGMSCFSEKAAPLPAGGGNKDASRRRLQSTSSKSFHPGDKTYQQYLEACGHFEYPLFLHVDQHSHLMVYGIPPEAATAAGCPFGAAHSVFATRQGKPVAEKEILMWSKVDEGLSMFQERESLPIGTFKLADLARAHEATPDHENDVGVSAVYDIVTNNCATYMVKMASTLGVKIDSRITSFVARRLLEESGKDLANKIRNSLNYFSLLRGDRRNLRSSALKATNGPTDQELVEALVNMEASGLLTD
jgi:hypothetical protein